MHQFNNENPMHLNPIPIFDELKSKKSTNSKKEEKGCAGMMSILVLVIMIILYGIMN
jgi:hypothetical protein